MHYSARIRRQSSRLSAYAPTVHWTRGSRGREDVLAGAFCRLASGHASRLSAPGSTRSGRARYVERGPFPTLAPPRGAIRRQSRRRSIPASAAVTRPPPFSSGRVFALADSMASPARLSAANRPAFVGANPIIGKATGSLTRPRIKMKCCNFVPRREGSAASER